MGCPYLTATERNEKVTVPLCARIRNTKDCRSPEPKPFDDISRKLRRNPIRGSCSAHEADKLYRLHRKRCRPSFKLENKELQSLLGSA